MGSKCEVLGVIPARGGSKGISYKNIHILNGKPLLWYVANAACKSRCISRLVCSTDDEHIIQVCKNIGVEVLERPKQLSLDTISLTDVLKHSLEELKNNEGYYPDLIARLLPTHPFLQPEQIDRLVQALFEDEDALSGQTLIPVPHQFHAYNQRIIRGGRATLFFREGYFTPLNRQQKPVVYGPGNLCITKSHALLEGYSHFAEPSIAQEIDPIYGVDIDSMEDMYRAKSYLDSGVLSVP